MFKDKVLLITGGTGSFGSTLLRKFANSDLKEIRVFSRDEKKQEDMRIALNNKKLKFVFTIFSRLYRNKISRVTLLFTHCDSILLF